MHWRAAFGPILLTFLANQTAFAQELVLDMPDNAETMLTMSEPMAQRTLPIGPFIADSSASQTIKGPLSQTAFRLAMAGRPNTLDLIEGLRSQIAQAGFNIVFECNARICGGFDFRYQLDLLPEPEMHVDLGDFRYLLAQRGDDVVSLMISRSPSYGFVQVTKMGPFALGTPKVSVASKSSVIPAPKMSDHTDLFTATLSTGSPVVLEDLIFPSGKSSLPQGAYVSLQKIADWLAVNPTKGVSINGYTDASGDVDKNLALSKSRAKTVRDWLITTFNIEQARVTSQGLGTANPRADNTTPEGRAKNRRVEVAAVTLN